MIIFKIKTHPSHCFAGVGALCLFHCFVRASHLHCIYGKIAESDHLDRLKKNIRKTNAGVHVQTVYNARGFPWPRPNRIRYFLVRSIFSRAFEVHEKRHEIFTSTQLADRSKILPANPRSRKKSEHNLQALEKIHNKVTCLIYILPRGPRIPVHAGFSGTSGGGDIRPLGPTNGMRMKQKGRESLLSAGNSERGFSGNPENLEETATCATVGRNGYWISGKCELQKVWV